MNPVDELAERLENAPMHADFIVAVLRTEIALRKGGGVDHQDYRRLRKLLEKHAPRDSLHVRKRSERPVRITDVWACVENAHHARGCAVGDVDYLQYYLLLCEHRAQPYQFARLLELMRCERAGGVPVLAPGDHRLAALISRLRNEQRPWYLQYVVWGRSWNADGDYFDLVHQCIQASKPLAHG